MRKPFLYFFSLFTFSALAQELIIPHPNPILHFTENLGQWQESIKYRVQLDGGLLFMEAGELTYNFYDKKKYGSFHTGGIGRTKDPNIKGHAIKVEFVGSNKSAKIDFSDPGEFYENFFIGNDQA